MSGRGGGLQVDADVELRRVHCHPERHPMPLLPRSGIYDLSRAFQRTVPSKPYTRRGVSHA